MLLFSSLGLLKHVPPKVKATPVALANVPVSDPLGPPIVDSLEVYNISSSKASVTWRAFASNPISTSNITSKLEVYKITNLGSEKILEFSKYTPQGVTITTGLEGLPTGAELSLRVRAEEWTGDTLVKYSEWLDVTDTFTTLGIAPGFSGLKDGVWYVDGEATTLPLSGSGEWEGVYFIQGNSTGWDFLPCLGWVGIIGGYLLINGVLANGTYSCTCCADEYEYIPANTWFNGMQVPEFFSGYGNVNDVLYQNYLPYTGPTENEYYIQGAITPLDSSGSGYMDADGIPETYHVNGVKYTGWLNGQNVYFINGKATTLGTDGTGIVDGKYYRNGVYLGAVGNPYDSSQAPGTTFTAGVTYG